MRMKSATLRPPRDLVGNRCQRLLIDPHRLGEIGRIAGGEAEMDERFCLGLLIRLGDAVDPIGFERLEQLCFAERAIRILR